MIQSALKVLTLSFFFSTITGFVLYRSGFFESETMSNSMQTSHNGGELLNSNVEQDTNHSPEINQSIDTPILPSSKSGRVFDLEEYQQKKKQEIMPSTKSGLHPIRINPDVEEVTLENPYMYSSKSLIIEDFQPMFENWFSQTGSEAIKKRPQLTPIDSSKIEKVVEKEKPKDSNLVSNRIEKTAKPMSEIEKPRGVAWGMIGLGVLGILFVAIGSIVYFKRKSK